MLDKRIVHIVTGLGLGGAERSVIELSNVLVELGWDATIIGLDESTEVLEYAPDVLVPVVSMGLRPRPVSVLKGLPALWRLLSKLKPAVVHAHMFHALWPALLWKLFHRRVRIVFTSHNARHAGIRGFLLRATRAWRDCDVIFQTGQHSHLNARVVRVIPNGIRPIVSTVRTGPRHGAWIAISVGRLTEAKAPVRLVEQFAKVARDDLELWLVGDGELRNGVEKAIARLKLDRRVKLLGVRRDIQALLEQAHLFVLGSSWEGMPLAIIEAGASALPVLATPVGSIPEMLADECGYVAQTSDFARTIESILADYGEALRRGEKFRAKTIDLYSVDSAAKAHAELYEALIQSKLAN